jgi:hypothetical protein
MDLVVLLETGVRPGVKPYEALDNARNEHRLRPSGGGDVAISYPPDNGTYFAPGNAGIAGPSLV